MERPDAAQIRQAMPTIDWQLRGYPLPADPISVDNPDPLQFLVDVAIDAVEGTTGRPQDATMPANLARIAVMADALMTVAMAADFSQDTLDALSSGDVLASFSADGYSENYRDTGVALKAQREAWMVHPWAPLNRLLWMLMTPEKIAYWVGFLQSGGVPHYGIAEIDWSGANRWGGVPGAPGDGGMAGDELRRNLAGSPVYPTGSNPGMLGSDGSLD